MKAKALYTTLTLCLGIAPVAFGQMLQSPPTSVGQEDREQGVSALRGQAPQSRRAVSGDSSYIPPTPLQEAQREQARSLDRDASTFLHAGHYAQAEAKARQVLALTGGYDLLGPEILAVALDAQGKTQEALQAYKVIVVGEGDTAPRTLLPYALLLLKAGQWAQAVAAYDKALPHLAFGELVRANSDFSPDAPEPTALATAIHIARGLTYNAEADWARETQDKEALAEYEKALALEPDSDLANYYYGYGLKKLGRTAQAGAAFQKTIKMAHGGVKLAAEKAIKEMKKAA